jgi:hypothetical protein
MVAQALTWNSHHVDERIAATMTLVMGVDELLRLVKGIAGRAQELTSQWAERRLFEPKESQVCSWLNTLCCLFCDDGVRLQSWGELTWKACQVRHLFSSAQFPPC